MKPKLKTEKIIKTYWSCANPLHRHQTEEVASKCIAAHEAEAKKRSQMERDGIVNAKTVNEYLQVLDLARKDMSRTQLAERLGCNKSYVAVVLAKAERLERQYGRNDPFGDLAKRARDALYYNGFKSVADVREGFKTGAIFDIPNIGKKSIADIESLLNRIDGKN